MSVYRVESLPGYDENSDPLFDVLHLPFEGDEVFCSQFGTPNRRFEFPRCLILFGDKTKLLHKHNIVSFFYGKLWSKELVNVLLSVGDFEYRFLNIQIFDLELYEWACANNNQILPDYAEANTDFGYFQLLYQENTLDCFDFERSEYQSPRRPGGPPRRIKKLVFKGGQYFPAMFREKNALGEFISQKAKDALEANGIYLPLTEIEVS